MYQRSDADDSRPKAFVVMPLNKSLAHVYEEVIKPIVEKKGFACWRATDFTEMSVIGEQVKGAIRAARLVICDITFGDNSVYYELGIARDREKPTILMVQSDQNVRHEIQHLRRIDYTDSDTGLSQLANRLDEQISAIFSEPTEIGYSEAAVRQRAYGIFLSRGREHGNDWEDWFRAEYETALETITERLDQIEENLGQAQVSLEHVTNNLEHASEPHPEFCRHNSPVDFNRGSNKSITQVN